MNAEGLSGQEKVDKLIKEVADDLGYFIYESSISIRGADSRLVVKIDSFRGISHKDCDKYAKEISRRLDDMQILPNYSMEVSSPGLQRKIRNIGEFIRFKESMVKIILNPENDNRVIIGIINNIIDTKITIKSNNGETVVDFNDIKKANLEF